MSYRPGRPTLALSTRASGLLGLPTLMRVARSAHLDGLDLDLTRRIWLLRPQAIITATEASGLPVTSLWAARVGPGPFERQRRLGAVEMGASLARVFGADLLIVDHPPGRGVGLSIAGIVETVEAIRRHDLAGTNLAVALRPRDLHGTREHLAQLASLRRTAEEWDFELALDLVGPLDCRWEAEAAVMRLLPRLRLVRAASVEPHPPDRSRAAMTSRVLATLVDAGFGGTIALAPELPPWRGCRAAAVADAAETARRRVRDRFAYVHQPERLDSFREFRQRS